jgi:hypothetical protein
VSGVVYADHPTNVNGYHRDPFVEQLLTAVWLFKSFPDVELWVSSLDFPTCCSLTVPVLQYSPIGLDTVQKSNRSNAVQLPGGSTVDVAHLAAGHGQKSQWFMHYGLLCLLVLGAAALGTNICLIAVCIWRLNKAQHTNNDLARLKYR